MRKDLRIIFITFLAFGAYFFLNKLYFNTLYRQLFEWLDIKSLAFGLAYIIVGIPIFIALLVLHKKVGSALSSIGIRTGFYIGLLLAFLFTLPMLIGYAIVFQLDTSVTFNIIFIKAICAGFFEELYFRGFLFGQVYRHTKFGFIPAIILGALYSAPSISIKVQTPGCFWEFF